MPGSDELEWTTYEDFTAGLWERGNDRECPPNGLLESTDCFPLPAGGLKAFARFEPIQAPFNASDAPASKTFALGIWVGADPSTTRGLYVLTMTNSASPFQLQMFCLASSGATIRELDLTGAGASWESTLSRADVTDITPAVQMVSFQTTASIANYFNLPITISVGSTNGIWRTDQSTAAFVFGFGTTSPEPWGLCHYQNRLVTIGPAQGAANPARSIWYTEPGSVATPSTVNYIQPGSAGGVIQFLHPYNPSDLIYVTRGNVFGDIQGPITTPAVKDLIRQGTNVRLYPVETEIGLVVVIANQGAYVLKGFSELAKISEPILGDPMGGPPVDLTNDTTGGPSPGDTCNLVQAPSWAVSKGAPASGQLGCYDNWVFFSNGYMLDSRTGAWFKQTSVPGARCWASDYSATRMYATTNTGFTVGSSLRPDPPMAYWSRMGEGSWTAMDTCSFTLPLIQAQGQRINLREIEYDLSTYDAHSTIEVQVESSSGTLEPLGPYELTNAPSESVRVIVPGHPAEWYKIRTILRSNRSGIEAPTLSKMRVATQSSTRTPVNR